MDYNDLFDRTYNEPTLGDSLPTASGTLVGTSVSVSAAAAVAAIDPGLVTFVKALARVVAERDLRSAAGEDQA